MRTDRATVRRGEVARAGAVQPYRVLARGEGEPHVDRLDLLPARSADAGRPALGSIAHLVHLTDIQLLDVQSPGRLEVIHRFGRRPDTRLMIPMQRPQEVLVAHATEALAQAINGVGGSPFTGAPVELAFSTGDNIDNMQLNALRWYLALLAGGEISLASGGPGYEGFQDGGVDWAWAPGDPSNRWGRDHGFPVVPGLLEAGLRPFRATGLDVGWLTCLGNHDCLVQGRTPATPKLDDFVTGSRRVTDVEEPFMDYVVDPEAYYTGPSRTVTADGSRRLVPRQEFVAAHLEAGGTPHGHGFTEWNRHEETAYYVHDLPGVRIIMLDTNNPAGGFEGSIDRAQLSWLRDRLEEVHDAAGKARRLVIVASHHPRTSMTNNRQVDDGPGAPARVLGGEVASLLHHFPGVVAWVAGHVHVHAARPCPPPSGARGDGFWEITTASVMEWPSQVRLIELVEDGLGAVAVACTVVDHDGPVTPAGLDGPLELAAWHRELASNDPTAVGGFHADGGPGDRNVLLWLKDPR